MWCGVSGVRLATRRQEAREDGGLTLEVFRDCGLWCRHSRVSGVRLESSERTRASLASLALRSSAARLADSDIVLVTRVTGSAVLRQSYSY